MLSRESKTPARAQTSARNCGRNAARLRVDREEPERRKHPAVRDILRISAIAEPAGE